MHTFRVTKDIDHAATRVWPLLANFADTYVYHPVVEHSESVNGKRTGLGAQRRCDLYSGGSVQERIVAFREEDMRYRVEVVDHGPFPMEHMEVEIHVEPLPGDKSRVTYAGSFRPKYGPLGWLMAKTMMASQFDKLMGQLIDGVDQHLTTGRLVQRDGALGAALAAA
ncbi:MAG: SRPBCC family protein [Myxococcales bacterium]|nr:SRPBCC family protein [Myxococcales bacterium]